MKRNNFLKENLFLSAGMLIFPPGKGKILKKSKLFLDGKGKFDFSCLL